MKNKSNQNLPLQDNVNHTDLDKLNYIFNIHLPSKYSLIETFILLFHPKSIISISGSAKRGKREEREKIFEKETFRTGS